MATALASVLGTRIPEFGMNVSDAEFYRNMTRWLAKKGYRYSEVPASGKPPKGYHLMLGISPRGGRHAVVGKGGRIVHDPHPQDNTGRGLASVDSYGILKPMESHMARVLDSLSLDTWEESKHPRGKGGEFSSSGSKGEKLHSVKVGASDPPFVSDIKNRFPLVSERIKYLKSLPDEKLHKALTLMKGHEDSADVQSVKSDILKAMKEKESAMAHDSEVPQEYRELMLPVQYRTGLCPACGKDAQLNLDGTVDKHGKCDGWGMPALVGESPVQDSGEKFKKLTRSLAHRKGVTNPKALAAYIGRKSMGKAAFQKKAAAGRKG